jgi:hypothetical protein
VKRTFQFAIVFGLLVVVGPGVFGRASHGQAPPSRPGVPIFAKEASWPKLPSKWKFGVVSSVAVDAQDHVWVLHRPRMLPPAQRAAAAPPVLEFDGAGNLLQAWGGPSEGWDGWDGPPELAYDWPENEHGITVDYKGNVWIGGNACPERSYRGIRALSDDQVLKFTNRGTFVMQIGRSSSSRGNGDTKNLRMPADIVVYQKTNEAFVADGYGNRRVIVFDADTGAFKRMWGAFGDKPVDSYRCPTIEVNESLIGRDGPGPKMFDVVHSLRISNDGLVYVADRNFRRVQVFTVEGKYLNQVFIDRTTNGYPGSLTFSADAEQHFLYVASREIVILDRKTLEVVGAVASAGGHGITSDSKGNLYTAQPTYAAQSGQGGGERGGGTVEKLVFKGLSSPSSR